MRIIILGSGSIVPTQQRFGTSIYIEEGENNVLLDCGPGTLEKMRRLSLSPFTVQTLCLTHFHIDHVTDLLPLLKLRAYTEEGLPNPRPQHLRIFGPKGLRKFLSTVIDDNEYFSYVKTLMRYESYCVIEEADPWRNSSIGGLSLTMAPVTHDFGAAYRIDTPHASVVFSGDTSINTDIIKLAEGADILIHECSFPSEKLVGKHVSERELGRILEAVKPRVLIVSHLYPIWEKQLHRLVEELEKGYRCRIIVPSDCLELIF
ncbi:MAG: MBL fold metallo-hydrolase [Nitrososphaerota archaeon]